MLRTNDGMAFEPDEQARCVIHLIFGKFEELGSANAVLRFLQKESLRIGVRQAQGAASGQLAWQAPNRSTITRILHHPIYAGAYVFGRHRADVSPGISGELKSGRRLATRDEWQVLLRDKLPAYITWEQWETNQRRLRENSTSFGAGPPRGALLIAGRITCGKCGARMPVSYKGKSTPYFTCCAVRMNFGGPLCQSFEARALESLVEQLVLTALQPASVELSLQAANSIEVERERLQQQYQQSVQRAVYDAELARRRYEEVDPSNRLVAAELERRWESLLQAQRKSEEALNRFRQESPATLTPEQSRSILELANDFPALWSSDLTTGMDRQTIVRSMVADIVVEVIDNTERLSVTVHWAGGFQSRHETRRCVQSFHQLDASEELARRIQQLYDEGCPLLDIADKLNGEGYQPAKSERFTQTSMARFAGCCAAKESSQRLHISSRTIGELVALCEVLGIKKPTISGWRNRGWVQVRRVGSRWIYWADTDELRRLQKLAAHPASGSTPTPAELTTPASRMPAPPGGTS